jgi:hypothetical protein
LTTGNVDTGGKFAAGIIDTGGKFATGINNTSKTGGKFATSVIDTGGNFDTGGKLIPVVNMELRISLRIFEKI